MQPTAAAIDAHAAARTFGCGPIWRRFGVTAGVTILRPLPNVADDVAKAECIGGLQSHRVRMAIGIVFEPGVVGRVFVIVAPPEPHRCPSPRRIFPDPPSFVFNQETYARASFQLTQTTGSRS